MKYMAWQRSIIWLVVFFLCGCSAGGNAGGGSGRVDAASEQTSAAVQLSSGHATVADPCEPAHEISRYMGTYKVDSFDRFAGGLTSEEKIRHLVGTVVELSNKTFKAAWHDKVVVNPRYMISCYPAAHEEGEVAPVARWGGHWSNFYGFGAKRKVITVLEIYDPAKSGKYPFDWFEIVRVDGKSELWLQDDGWLLKLVKLN